MPRPSTFQPRDQAPGGGTQSEVFLVQRVTRRRPQPFLEVEDVFSSTVIPLEEDLFNIPAQETTPQPPLPLITDEDHPNPVILEEDFLYPYTVVNTRLLAPLLTVDEEIGYPPIGDDVFLTFSVQSNPRNTPTLTFETDSLVILFGLEQEEFWFSSLAIESIPRSIQLPAIFLDETLWFPSSFKAFWAFATNILIGGGKDSV